MKNFTMKQPGERINEEEEVTHLDEAGEESGFLEPVGDVEELEVGEQLAEADHQADGVEGVGQGICNVGNSSRKRR